MLDRFCNYFVTYRKFERENGGVIYLIIIEIMGRTFF